MCGVWLAGQAVEYAMTHTRGQVRAWLARRIARIDPEAADRKHRARVKKRCVRLWADPDGMATISAYLSAEEARRCGRRCGARPRDRRAVGCCQRGCVVGLMTGTVVGTLIPVTVLQTSAGEELAGYGPISPGHAAKLRCVDSTLIDLTVVPEPSGGYRPAPRLARWVRATHRHCRFPGAGARGPSVIWTMWSRFRPGYVCGQFGAVVPVSPPVEDARELAGASTRRRASALDQPAGANLRHLPARPIGTGRLCPATARYLMPDPADHPCGFGLPGSRQAGPDRPVYATRA